MPGEDHKNQKKIQCWIPLVTWEQIEALGYSSPTIAVTKAFEKLLEDPRTDPHKSHDIPNGSQQIPNESPEIPTLKARLEELKAHNETLKAELEKSSQREEDLKQMHNNYFLQVQTLINQKAIEAPGNKKPWYKFW